MTPVMPAIWTGMVLAGLGAVAGISVLVLVAYAVHIIVSGADASVALNNIMPVLLFVAVVYFLLKTFSFQVSHLAAFRLEQILRTELSEHLARVPLGFIINTGSGALKKVMLDDVKNLHAFVADTTPFIGRTAVAPILSLILMFVLDWRLAVAGVSVLFIGGVIMSVVMRDSEILRKDYEQSQEQINSAVIEFVQAMPVVRTFDDGTSSFGRYNKALDYFRVSLSRWVEKTGVSGRLGIIILSAVPTLISVSAAGAFFIHKGTLDFSVFLASLFISTGMADAMMPLMWLTNFIKKSGASAIRIQEILDTKTLAEPDNPKFPKSFDVEFENVSFRYEDRDEYALKDVSFIVPQGTVTALVGPSGAGKSTVAKLIPRFWDVECGMIRIGGADIRDISTEALMNTVSFVFQDTFLFHDSIASNILMANPHASSDDMIEAAKAAQIHDFIMSLPDGYETKAGDRGVRLSGGQKQRITIARAILRNSPVVVLDEATAFADPENEEEIIRAISNLTKNKTVIVIAHRLSTITDVNSIVVFDKGKVSETGRHDELLMKDGVYARLWGNYIKAQDWHMQQEKGEHRGNR